MPVPPSLLRRLLLASSLLALSGCMTHPVTSKDSGPVRPSQPGHPAPALCSLRDRGGAAIPATFTGTVNPTHRTRAANHVVQLNSIQTACCGEFDRVVFDFDGLRLPPDYTVEYIPGPAQECGSGADVPLAGSAILRLKFKTTQAHTDAGAATVTNRNRRLPCPNLRQLVVTCDFEGEVEVVLGLASKKPYRAVELLNDSKLVIDVKR